MQRGTMVKQCLAQAANLATWTVRRAQMWRRCVVQKKNWRLLLYFLLGVWAIQANPFGLSSAADKALSDELARIRAYVSPVAPAPITVVAIDWESINGLYNHS